jgi:iron complex transport system ATP-binding protein
MIAATAVTVRAGRQTLLDNLSLRLPPASFTAVLGPNGAGKSTLLKTLSGVLAPDAGQVTLSGTALASLSAASLARSRAVLSQHSAPVLGLTVADTVALGRLVFRHTPDQADDLMALARVRARFALDSLWQRSLASLSGGERQRVHIARAAAQLWRRDNRADGLALFLDEPAASLDLAQQTLALDFARDCARRGAAVMAVLHDPNHALGATQVVLLQGGRVLRCGPASAVLTPENLAECLGVTVHLARRQDGTPAFVV